MGGRQSGTRRVRRTSAGDDRDVRAPFRCRSSGSRARRRSHPREGDGCPAGHGHHHLGGRSGPAGDVPAGRLDRGSRIDRRNRRRSAAAASRRSRLHGVRRLRGRLRRRAVHHGKACHRRRPIGTADHRDRLSGTAVLRGRRDPAGRCGPRRGRRTNAGDGLPPGRRPGRRKNVVWRSRSRPHAERAAHLDHRGDRRSHGCRTHGHCRGRGTRRDHQDGNRRYRGRHESRTLSRRGRLGYRRAGRRGRLDCRWAGRPGRRGPGNRRSRREPRLGHRMNAEDGHRPARRPDHRTHAGDERSRRHLGHRTRVGDGHLPARSPCCRTGDHLGHRGRHRAGCHGRPGPRMEAGFPSSGRRCGSPACLNGTSAQRGLPGGPLAAPRRFLRPPEGLRHVRPGSCCLRGCPRHGPRRHARLLCSLLPSIACSPRTALRPGRRPAALSPPALQGLESL